MTYSEICNAALNLGLSLLLAQYLGIMGVALGTLLAILTSFGTCLMFFVGCLAVQYLHCWCEALCTPIFCAIIWCVAGWIAGEDAVTNDLWTFLVKTGIHGIVSVLVWLIFERLASIKMPQRKSIL